MFYSVEQTRAFSPGQIFKYDKNVGHFLYACLLLKYIYFPLDFSHFPFVQYNEF